MNVEPGFRNRWRSLISTNSKGPNAEVNVYMFVIVRVVEILKKTVAFSSKVVINHNHKSLIYVPITIIVTG